MTSGFGYIEITPGKRSGEPCVKGTRIAVKDVVGWVESGLSIEEILEDYPELSNEAIEACIEYQNATTQDDT